MKFNRKMWQCMELVAQTFLSVLTNRQECLFHHHRKLNYKNVCPTN